MTDFIADNTGLAIMSTLRNYGIDTIFGIPGTHNLEFYRPLERLGIRPVTTRHEQGAGYAADGWCQQTGLPGVVITTSGPGLLNVLSSAALAYCESRPLVVLAPGPPRGQEHADRGTLHETKDTAAAAASVLEWSRRVTSAHEAVEAVHDAFQLFRTTRPRPIYIEVPLDVLEGPADLSPELLAARPAPAPARADHQAVLAAARALATAESPIILAGGGSLVARDDVLLLAEALGAPVITTMNGKAAIPESHQLSLGSNIRLRAAQAACSAADVLLVIGSKVGEAELWDGAILPTGTVIRLDILESQMETNLHADIRLVGNTAVTVQQLIEAVEAEGRILPTGSARATALLARLHDEARNHAPALVALAQEINRALPANAVVAGDSSQICYFGTSTFIPQDRPHSFLYMATYATLGYGLAAAIGAKLGAPDRPVVCVAGDGALMFSIQELATAVEQHLDLVVVCVDNGGYGEIKQNQADRGMPPIAVVLHQPDWAALAAAFGGRGVTVNSLDELGPAISRALTAGGLQLVHVPPSVMVAH